MEKTPVRIRVIYADTDAMGIVYHTNHIRWFEIGRTELFRDMKIQRAEMEAAGVSLPLTRVYCHYLQPTQYDDLVLLETDIQWIKRASIKFAYAIRKEGKQQVLAEGYTVHACTDRKGGIIRMPQPIADRIRHFYPNIS